MAQLLPIIVTPCVQGIHYRRDEFVANHPVNMALCTYIVKSKLAWYPDNEGRPAIAFKGIGVKWAYDNEEDRDKDWQRLISNEWLTTINKE